MSRVAWLLALASPAAWAVGTHADPVAPVILGVTTILFLAVLGRHLALWLGQPSVLGELVMGMLLGNIGYWLQLDFLIVLREGPGIFAMIEHSFEGVDMTRAARDVLGAEAGPVLDILRGAHGVVLLQMAHALDVMSRYGVIFLLFLVGLETSLDELRRVGGASLRVAVTGLLLPFALGFAALRVVLPDLSVNTDLFVAAALGATSVGITARVLRELGRQHSREAHIILGAAVIDDVLGLLLLTIVSGIVVSGSVAPGELVTTVALAVGFIWAALRLGPLLVHGLVRLVRRLDEVEAKMLVSFLFVMLLSWAASLVGLATIVGAFAAGVILHEGYFDAWHTRDRRPIAIKELIQPLEVVMVPIFFVLMGIQVKLDTLAEPRTLLVALALTAAAIAGKLLSGLLAGLPGWRWLSVGLGMLPRGEVGLIFASIGSTLGVIDDALFGAVVLMVIVTTLLAPPLLKWSMGRFGTTA